MAKKPNQMNINAFAPRTVCGELVEPFCEPTSLATESQLIGAAVNLIWWAMHEALADGKVEEARKFGKMIVDVVGRELSTQDKRDAMRIVDEAIDHYRDLPSDGSDSE